MGNTVAKGLWQSLCVHEKSENSNSNARFAIPFENRPLYPSTVICKNGHKYEYVWRMCEADLILS